MPLTVNYRNRIGYYTETQKIGADNKEYKYKIWICHANALCAMMFFHKKEENGEKVDIAQLVMFFVDNQHAKKCIEDGIFNNCSHFHFREKQMDADLWKLVKTMTAHGIKVTIE